MVGANWLVMCEPGWNPAINRQASGRIWRPGQHRARTVLTLISQHTIEEKIMLRACSKQGCWPLCPAMASSQELRRVLDYLVPTLWSALGGEARGIDQWRGLEGNAASCWAGDEQMPGPGAGLSAATIRAIRFDSCELFQKAGQEAAARGKQRDGFPP